MSDTATGSPSDRADVELRLPADGAFVSVLRTLTAGLAARLDFTIDEIEDLRIAVGEACALVLEEARAGADLCCEFHLASGQLTMRVGVEQAEPREPDYDSFAWQVLTTLASDAALDTGDSRFAVTLTMRSAHPETVA
jgi:serine/threonine-protein kinase RsbW